MGRTHRFRLCNCKCCGSVGHYVTGCSCKNGGSHSCLNLTQLQQVFEAWRAATTMHHDDREPVIVATTTATTTITTTTTTTTTTETLSQPQG